jgi:hypothetical protein
MSFLVREGEGDQRGRREGRPGREREKEEGAASRWRERKITRTFSSPGNMRWRSGNRQASTQVLL